VTLPLNKSCAPEQTATGEQQSRPDPEMARAVLATVEDLRNPQLVRFLSGGPASHSWLVQDGDQQFVLRLDRAAAARLRLDRRAELNVLEVVGRAGIGPQVIWADADAGILLTSYLTGRPWRTSDVRNANCLNQVALTLKQLFSLPFAGTVLNPASAATSYADTIGTEVARASAQTASQIIRDLQASPHEQSLCHNDLIHSNIIGTAPVQLIDWEYAALGDPLFDMAVITRQHAVPLPVATELLRCLWPDPGAELLARFEAWCEAYELLANLWYQAVGLPRPVPTSAIGLKNSDAG